MLQVCSVDQKCIDPLYLQLIILNLSSPCRNWDLNLHTNVVHFKMLNAADRWVTVKWRTVAPWEVEAE